MAKRTTWSKPTGYPDWLYRFNKRKTVLTIRKVGTGPVLHIPVPEHFPGSLDSFVSGVAGQLATQDLPNAEYRVEVTETPVLYLGDPEATPLGMVRNGADHTVPLRIKRGLISHKSRSTRDRDLTGPYPQDRMNGDAYLGRLNQ